MAKYLKDVEEARSIILRGEGKIIVKYKLNKRFFSKLSDYANEIYAVKNIIDVAMIIKDIDYAHNQGVQMNDDYMIMDEKKLFTHLTKKGVTINYNLNKLHSANLKTVLDGVIFMLSSKNEFDFKDLQISTVFKKGWWGSNKRSNDTDSVEPEYTNNQNNKQSENLDYKKKRDQELIDESLKEVFYHLNEMGLEATQHGISIALLSFHTDNYTATEIASQFVLCTFAFEIKEIIDDSPDIFKLMSYARRTMGIVDYLKNCTDGIRPIQLRNDLNALANVVKVGPDQKEWLDKVLSDPQFQKRVARFKSRI